MDNIFHNTLMLSAIKDSVDNYRNLQWLGDNSYLFKSLLKVSKDLETLVDIPRDGHSFKIMCKKLVVDLHELEDLLSFESLHKLYIANGEDFLPEGKSFRSTIRLHRAKIQKDGVFDGSIEWGGTQLAAGLIPKQGAMGERVEEFFKMSDQLNGIAYQIKEAMNVDTLSGDAEIDSKTLRSMLIKDFKSEDVAEIVLMNMAEKSVSIYRKHFSDQYMQLLGAPEDEISQGV